MKHFTKYGITTWLVLLCTLMASAQGLEMRDSVGLRAYLAQRNDTLLIRYDSAFVLNKKTFGVYQDAYTRLKNNNQSTQKLFLAYDSLVALQDRMLQAKEADYQFLKRNFDSLVTASNTFVNRTDVNVTAINQSLTRAEGNIYNIQHDLSDAMDKLKLENRKKLKIAIGGFAVGVGVTSLIFLLTK